MRYKTIVTTLACCWVLFGTPAQARAQCAGQDPLDCRCENLRTCNMTICVGGTNYDITIEYCQQLPVMGFIKNPCTAPGCARPLDQVSWIKRICVPQALHFTSAAAIYNGIIAATDLCDDDCFGAVIPNCTIGSTGPCPVESPTVSANAYCHVLAFPRCYTWVAGCIEACDDNACNQFCFAEFRYCNQNNMCTRCVVKTCGDDENFTHCGGGCSTVDCGDLNGNGCAP